MNSVKADQYYSERWSSLISMDKRPLIAYQYLMNADQCRPTHWSACTGYWSVLDSLYRSVSETSDCLSVFVSRWSALNNSLVSIDWSMVSTDWSMVSTDWSMVSTEWSMVSTDWSMVSTEWSMVSTEWSMVIDTDGRHSCRWCWINKVCADQKSRLAIPIEWGVVQCWSALISYSQSMLISTKQLHSMEIDNLDCWSACDQHWAFNADQQAFNADQRLTKSFFGDQRSC